MSDHDPMDSDKLDPTKLQDDPEFAEDAEGVEGSASSADPFSDPFGESDGGGDPLGTSHDPFGDSDPFGLGMGMGADGGTGGSEIPVVMDPEPLDVKRDPFGMGSEPTPSEVEVRFEDDYPCIECIRYFW